MVGLIKQVFIVLLSFSESLARDRTKCLFLNDEPCMVRPTLTDLNPAELKYYHFIISLDKCARSCNVFSLKISISKETKDINVKVFNIITNKNEGKTMKKIFHVIVMQIKNGIIKHVNVNIEIIIIAKMIIIGILVHVFVRIASI